MKQLLLLVLALPLLASSQDSSAYFLKNVCDVKVDGSGDAQGVKLKFSSPCMWTVEKGSQPDMIRVHKHETGKGTIVSNLMVRDLGVTLQQSDMDEFFSTETLDAMAQQIGDLVSTKVLQIDGRPCGEVKLTTQAEGSARVHHVFYYFIIGEKMVVKSYSVVSGSSETSEATFTKLEGLFAGLAGTIKFDK